MGLGDAIESALKSVGITSDRVEYWLGRPCGCGDRKNRLNALSAWARRVLAGKTERAAEYLSSLIKE